MEKLSQVGTLLSGLKEKYRALQKSLLKKYHH